MAALRKALVPAWRVTSPRLHTFATNPRPLRFSTCSLLYSRPPVFQATNTTVFPFGVPSNDPEHALFRDLSLTIGDNDCWAVLSPSSHSSAKSNFLSTIQHQARFHPAHSASHPILASLPPIERSAEEGGPREPTVEDIIQFVSFKTRLGRSGDFDDYTARYYSIRDEDKLTTLEHLKATTGEQDEAKILETAKSLRMEKFLDLPLITLSNGQTRRARILRALLAKPELLVLEEPFTGLDVSSRALLVSLLSSLHSNRTPRVLLVLRPQDELPPFITHMALVSSSSSSGPGEVILGTKSEVLATPEARSILEQGEQERAALQERRERRKEEAAKMSAVQDERQKVVELKDVNVVYGRKGETEERRILQGINWTIREGEKWVLAGHNGSGKSTLLSLILGDHPRSYTEDVSLFGKPRDKQATATLQANIGHVSPEIYNAFPRKYGPAALTAYDAIVTGFESVFSYRKPTASQASSVDSLLGSFAHPLLTPTFLSQPFADLTPGEQSLILLLRALVKRPPLLVLDEPFSGMDSETIRRVKRYLDEELEERQSVVLISHFEEEVPESVGRRLELEEGRVKETL
ncbi:SPOSA6832_00430 [Sporobolomyces salmonicolor]|uniref:SPOSA6832_00430-mRNA-1:cds n=1 Tax=Sporidiobolus salmonicolor TaxID=5005 RepID=A0A0D6EGD0_SPOSA|nr:SPOSA6832_00430 [Sporobolomyces salmonicolor]